jgi:hypothetical protein
MLRDLSQPDGSQQAADQKIALIQELAGTGSIEDQAIQLVDAALLLRTAGKVGLKQKKKKNKTGEWGDLLVLCCC